MRGGSTGWGGGGGLRDHRVAQGGATRSGHRGHTRREKGVRWGEAGKWPPHRTTCIPTSRIQD